MSKEKAVMILMAKEMTDEEIIKSHPFESVTAFCTICGAECWCSDHNYPYIERGEVTPVCGECGVGIIAADENPEFAMTKESADLFKRTGGTAQMQRLLELMNRAGKQKGNQ